MQRKGGRRGGNDEAQGPGFATASHKKTGQNERETLVQTSCCCCKQTVKTQKAHSCCNESYLLLILYSLHAVRRGKKVTGVTLVFLSLRHTEQKEVSRWEVKRAVMSVNMNHNRDLVTDRLTHRITEVFISQNCLSAVSSTFSSTSCKMSWRGLLQFCLFCNGWICSSILPFVCLIILYYKFKSNNTLIYPLVKIFNLFHIYVIFREWNVLTLHVIGCDGGCKWISAGAREAG